MKKASALILFGLSIAYISTQAQWAIMQAVSLLSVFVGLGFSIFGFMRRKNNIDVGGK